jgi:enoyl-CoA hydratase/carnithine racemase
MARHTQIKTYELTSQQVEALELLLAGETVTSTAATLGVARETVSRWRHNDPAFVAAYNEALQSAWEASYKRLLDARGKAIDKLAELLDNKDPGVSLKAAAALVKIDIPMPKGKTNPRAAERQIEHQALLDSM